MSTDAPPPARVALVGANGHGLSHRRAMAQLQASGQIELVALCDLAPVRDEPGAPVPPAAQLFTDYRRLLAESAPEVVVVCTPPHTHLEVATAAVRAGADLLLEKPPVVSVAEHHALAAELAGTGRVCQVGFQALGSRALAALVAAIRRGELGRVTAVSAVGAWQRPDSYYRRAVWAGRRSVGGRPVLDGALVNPFAHALMQCLAVAEAAAGAAVWPTRVELERYRARPIEVDDTAAVRVHTGGGPPVLVAVTLCGDRHIAGEVIVHGSRGLARLGYTTDELLLPGDPAPHPAAGRTGLLENLLAHRRDPTTPLLAPLPRTLAFTALVQTLLRAPAPHLVDPALRRAHGDGPDRVVTVPGSSDVVRRAAEEVALPDALGAGWGGEVWRCEVDSASAMQHTGG